MALRLGDYTVRGELWNPHSNYTHGWLELRDREQLVTFELLGNPDPDLLGKRLRFECNPQPLKSEEPLSAKELKLPDRFVGATGDMTVQRQVRLFDCPMDEFIRLSKAGKQPPTFWRRGLYLEWFGNCGRVVLELGDPQACFIETLDGEDVPFPLPPLPEPPFDPNDPPEPSQEDFEAIQIETTSTGAAKISSYQAGEEDGDEDPYALFSDDFKKLIQTGEPNLKLQSSKEVDQISDILDNANSGPSLRELIGPSPNWEELSEQEIEIALKTAVGTLGLYNIAFHMCEHSTYEQAARYLFETLADEEFSIEQFKDSSWFAHYHTAEQCPACQAEFDDDSIS